MNTLVIFFDIILITLLGYSLGGLFFFDKSYAFIKKISLSYPLGFGLVGLQMFFYHILNIKWSFFAITIPWVIVYLLFYFKSVKNKRLFKYNIQALTRKLSLQERLLLVLVTLLYVFVGIESIIRPLQTWDGWSNWVLRSNVFYINNNIDPYYFRYTTDEYPLIIPLTVTFGYISIGAIDDRSILLFYFMFYAALGGIFYSILREFSTRKITLLFTFLLLSTQNLVRHGGRFEVGQADLAVGLYILAGSGLIYDFIRLKTYKSILLLNVFLAITAQIKNDALPFVLTAFFIEFFIVIKMKMFRHLIYITSLPLLFLPWQYFKLSNQLYTNFLFREGVTIHIERTTIVLSGMFKEFFNLQNWGLLWMLFLFYLFFFYRFSKQSRLFFFIFTIQFLAYFLIFLITPSDPKMHIENVINKLFLHIAPLALLVLAIDFKVKNGWHKSIK